MNNELYSSLVSLKEAIENDKRVKALNEIEKRMSEDEEVMRLSYLKDVASFEYDDALKHFKEDDEVVLQKQKTLYETKYNLDSHPLVKEYNQKYQEVRLLYNHINDVLFSEFVSKNKCQK